MLPLHASIRTTAEGIFESISMSLGYEHPHLALQAYCIARGSHKRTRTDKYGFPICYFSRRKRPNDFGTGDFVRVKVTRGKNASIWTGRATLTDGKLSVETKTGRVKGTFKNGKVLSKNDGYKYQYL